MSRVIRTGMERLIRRLKHDPDYRLEGDLPTADYLELGWRRGWEATRGLLIRRKFHSSRGVVFAGRGVTIRHGRHIRAGRSLVLGDAVILDALSRTGIVLGANVSIARGTALVCSGVVARPGEGIIVGDRTGIGDHCFFWGQGGIDIGSDVLFGPGVRIFSENHRFDRGDVVIRGQGEARGRVQIEDDCWIGGGATVLAGVRIGRGSVVGAGSVVVRDVPPQSVVAGVPARVLRNRLDEPARRAEPTGSLNLRDR
jgi:acetyltransferase-like isoleucine patch superfamily enzyme